MQKLPIRNFIFDVIIQKPLLMHARRQSTESIKYSFAFTVIKLLPLLLRISVLLNSNIH